MEILTYNEETESLIAIDDNDNFLKEIKFQDESVIPSYCYSDNNLLYSNSNYESILMDWKNRTVKAKFKVDGYYPSIIYNGYALYDKDVEVDDGTKVDVAFRKPDGNIVYRCFNIPEEMYVYDRIFNNGRFILLMGVRLTYLSIYDVKDDSQRRIDIPRKGNTVPVCIFSADDGGFYILYVSLDKYLVVSHLNSNYVFDMDYGVNLGYEIDFEDDYDLFEADNKIYISIGTQKNYQLLAIIDMRTHATDVSVISHSPVEYFNMYFLEHRKNILFNLTKYTSDYGYREYAILCDYKGNIIENKEYLESLKFRSYNNGSVTNSENGSGGEMVSGKIKFYNEKKGYGFILAENGDNVFFHISVVSSVEDLYRGQAVELMYEASSKGLSATCINICETFEKAREFFRIGDSNYKLSNIKDFRLEYGWIFVDGSQVFLFNKPYYLSLQDMSIFKPRESYQAYRDQPILTIETYQNNERNFYNLDEPEEIERAYRDLCNLLN